ncbi:hypothetical protein GCM10025886_03470 [Tetragenococcus halophilus subsp. flandriensis]|uniref:hypothetical protein n=1 Tax=Tetragenococcus halophilus TaxID=51669 RepID=UPI0023E9CA62|nr:hypothetical protein [Tetragenococcus halophilus]GMA07196.1 hypothetical protein GCM10025886_03470 [Tetragenococcus halophilus subsp. flandriensis]
MENNLVAISSIIVALIFVSLAIFQELLTMGYPLGEFTLGGYYKTLPKKLRVVSAISSLILLFMAVVVLKHANVLKGLDFLPTSLLMWIIVIYLALITLANAISQSKKEKYTMTPLSGIAFLLCLFITLT